MAIADDSRRGSRGETRHERESHRTYCAQVSESESRCASDRRHLQRELTSYIPFASKSRQVHSGCDMSPLRRHGRKKGEYVLSFGT